MPAFADMTMGGIKGNNNRAAMTFPLPFVPAKMMSFKL